MTNGSSLKSKYYKKICNYHIITNNHIGIIQINSFVNTKKEFNSFLFNTFKEIRETGIKNLIIDIRKNGGGSDRVGDLLFNYITDKPYLQHTKAEYKLSEEYMDAYKKYLNIKWYNIFFHPEYIKYSLKKKGAFICEKSKKERKPNNNKLLFNGNIYLLIGSSTCSAAMDFAAAFKYYKMGIVVGKETGGALIEHSNAIPFILPNTQLQGMVASHKAFAIGAKNDGHGVIPDYEVVPSIDDVYNGTDRVMEFTKELIEK